MSAGSPRVSVLLPVRDGERYLGHALDNVLAQTLHELEVVVVDDGSRDGTADVLGRYDDPRLRPIVQERLGLVAALRSAVAAARAPYLARMDADDVSLPARLERQLEALERRPRAALVVCGVELVDEAGRGRGTIVLPDDDRALRRRLLLRNPFTHGAVMLRREAVDAAGGYRATYGANEDYDLWRRLARGWELAAIPDVLYRYRVHAAAVTRTDPDRVRRREELRRELWSEPALTGALWEERDPGEARALTREALRQGRPRLALRAAAGYLAARTSSS